MDFGKIVLGTKKNSTMGMVFLQNSYACSAVTMELVFVLDKLSVVVTGSWNRVPWGSLQTRDRLV